MQDRKRSGSFAAAFQPRTTMQARRYEFKYIIDERQAATVRDFVACHLQPDEHTLSGSQIGYPVYSLYLDSADLKTCNATVRGDRNRFKLRVRFYDDQPDSPVFCEIKQRKGTVILKQRATVRRSAIDRLVTGDPPSESHLSYPSSGDYQALQEFCRRRDDLQAGPISYVSYRRVGYELPEDNSVRVTFDRALLGAPFSDRFRMEQDWEDLKVRGVVLELKFTGRFPKWMRDLTQWFNLSRDSMPKYVKSVSLLRRG